MATGKTKSRGNILSLQHILSACNANAVPVIHNVSSTCSYPCEKNGGIYCHDLGVTIDGVWIGERIY
jgi:hypothetical protein